MGIKISFITCDSSYAAQVRNISGNHNRLLWIAESDDKSLKNPHANFCFELDKYSCRQTFFQSQDSLHKCR